MLNSRLSKLVISLSLLALAGFVTAAFAASSEPVAAQQTSPTPTPQPAPRMPGKIGTGDNWIILDLPPDAAQIDYGREIYRLVCSACHGDIGQGLTPEWRSTWAPEDQNCWQSKCHGDNHPPEGFTFPVAPAINNLTRQSKFATALQLQAYIHAAMPWYKPGGLTEERAWQVTAYVLHLNQIHAGPVLNAATAATIRLAPESAASLEKSRIDLSGEASAPATSETLVPNTTLLLSAALFATVGLIGGGVLLWRRARR
jgi:mono/diheme cytochrome c family protein